MAQFTTLRSEIKNWTLQSDDKLIKTIQFFSDKILFTEENTFSKFSQLKYVLNACNVEISNTYSQFQELSEKKFTENRMAPVEIQTQQPQEQTIEKEKPLSAQINNTQNDSKKIDFFKKAISFGMDAFGVGQDDQNEELPEERSVSQQSQMMNQSQSNLKSQRVPCFIGSKAFQKDDYIGLMGNYEDEEEEQKRKSRSSSLLQQESQLNIQPSQVGISSPLQGNIPPPPQNLGPLPQGNIPPPPPLLGNIPPPPPINQIPQPPQLGNSIPPPPAIGIPPPPPINLVVSNNAPKPPPLLMPPPPLNNLPPPPPIQTSGPVLSLEEQLQAALRNKENKQKDQEGNQYQEQQQVIQKPRAPMSIQDELKRLHSQKMGLVQQLQDEDAPKPQMMQKSAIGFNEQSEGQERSSSKLSQSQAIPIFARKSQNLFIDSDEEDDNNKKLFSRNQSSKFDIKTLISKSSVVRQPDDDDEDQQQSKKVQFADQMKSNNPPMPPVPNFQKPQPPQILGNPSIKLPTPPVLPPIQNNQNDKKESNLQLPPPPIAPLMPPNPPAIQKQQPAAKKKLNKLFDDDDEEDPFETARKIGSEYKRQASMPVQQVQNDTKKGKKGLFDDSDEDDGIVPQLGKVNTQIPKGILKSVGPTVGTQQDQDKKKLTKSLFGDDDEDEEEQKQQVKNLNQSSSQANSRPGLGQSGQSAAIKGSRNNSVKQMFEDSDEDDGSLFKKKNQDNDAQKVQAEKEQKEREQREKEQREQKEREQKEREQREKQQRENEQREKEQREKQQRENEQKEKEQREREQREREQREREQREREQREREQREREQREREQREREQREQKERELREKQLKEQQEKQQQQNQEQLKTPQPTTQQPALSQRVATKKKNILDESSENESSSEESSHQQQLPPKIQPPKIQPPIDIKESFVPQVLKNVFEDHKNAHENIFNQSSQNTENNLPPNRDSEVNDQNKHVSDNVKNLQNRLNFNPGMLMGMAPPNLRQKQEEEKRKQLEEFKEQTQEKTNTQVNQIERTGPSIKKRKPRTIQPFALDEGQQKHQMNDQIEDQPLLVQQRDVKIQEINQASQKQQEIRPPVQQNIEPIQIQEIKPIQRQEITIPPHIQPQQEVKPQLPLPKIGEQKKKNLNFSSDEDDKPLAITKPQQKNPPQVKNIPELDQIKPITSVPQTNPLMNAKPNIPNNPLGRPSESNKPALPKISDNPLQRGQKDQTKKKVIFDDESEDEKNKPPQPKNTSIAPPPPIPPIKNVQNSNAGSLPKIKKGLFDDDDEGEQDNKQKIIENRPSAQRQPQQQQPRSQSKRTLFDDSSDEKAGFAPQPSRGNSKLPEQSLQPPVKTVNKKNLFDDDEDDGDKPLLIKQNNNNNNSIVNSNRPSNNNNQKPKKKTLFDDDDD